MKLKPKKLIKSTVGLFSLTGKKGKRAKSLFVVGGGSGLYPSYHPKRTKSRRKTKLF